MEVYEVHEKVVLVTGGAGGVGEGIVKEFLEQGAKHVAILDVAEEAGKQLENELNEKHGEGKARFFKCDVTKEEDIDNAFKQTLEDFGYIDVVVNNAGIMNDDEKVFRKEIEVNVIGVVTITLKALKAMRIDKGNKGGTVINISSVTGLRQGPSLPVYFATKSAILQFSNCLGLEENYSRTGVRIITVCFGATATALITESKTGFIDETMKSYYDDLMAKIPVQKQESAVCGVMEAFKLGASGSTWLAANNEPPIDYTNRVKSAYKCLFTYDV